jgi:hypothetical protein
MAIVMRKDSLRVMEALNAALNALEEKGVYREIYSRYLPLDPFADGIAMPPRPAQRRVKGRRSAQSSPAETGPRYSFSPISMPSWPSFGCAL